MFSRHTIDAIVALTAVDPCVTESERRRIDDVLNGTEISDSRSPAPYGRAAEVLGTSVSTVKRLVKAGRLVSVIGTGSRAIGVSWDSLDQMLKGTVRTGT